MRLISQLIKGISRELQELPKYFNGAAILAIFVLPLSGVLPAMLVLNLNHSGSVKVAFCSFL